MQYIISCIATDVLQKAPHPPAYAAMEPRQYRPKGGMSASEGRNGGDEKKRPVELAKKQNGRATRTASYKVPFIKSPSKKRRSLICNN